MKESRALYTMVQAAVVEILNQVGFEKASEGALSIMTDLATLSISLSLSHLQETVFRLGAEEPSAGSILGEPPTDLPDREDLLGDEAAAKEEEEGIRRGEKEMSVILQCVLVAHYGGPIGSYKREELVSFLKYQLATTKQLKEKEERKEGSLLEMLRIGDRIERQEEEESLVDFGGGEERQGLEEKKYLDSDVREYLESEEPPHKKSVLGQIRELVEEICPEEANLGERAAEVFGERREFLKKDLTRDYEYLIGKKRLNVQYVDYYDGGYKTPLLDDLVVISANRKIAN
jgi:Histone-fold protein